MQVSSCDILQVLLKNPQYKRYFFNKDLSLFLDPWFQMINFLNKSAMGCQGSDHRHLLCTPCHSHANYSQLSELKFNSNQKYYVSTTRGAAVTRHQIKYVWKKPLGGPLKNKCYAQNNCIRAWVVLWKAV